MDALRKAGIAARAIRAVLTKRHAPLLVSWNVTRRCNLTCRYCRFHDAQAGEAETGQVFETIRDLARLGARYVGFSGGEPMLRSDIGEIVAACAGHGMSVSIQTNGVGLPGRLGELSGLSEVRVSLDGPRDVQEEVRGPGSFDAAVEAVRACREAGLPVMLTSVVHALNVGRLGECLDQAGELGVGIAFQPIDHRFSSHLDPGDPLYPDIESFRDGIDELIRAKRDGRREVVNSLAGLKYMRGWPKPDPLRCVASRVLCTVDPAGRVFLCDMFPGYEDCVVDRGEELGKTLCGLRLPRTCERCITGSMADLNLAAGGDLGALLGLIRRLAGIR